MEENAFEEEPGEVEEPAPPQPPQQQYQQQPQYQFQKPDFMKDLTTNDWLAKMVFISIIFMLIGMLLIHAAPFQTNYGSNPPSAEVQADDAASQRTMTYLGNILTDIGVFLIGLFFLLAGIYRDNMEKWVRVALIIFALILLVFAWFGLTATFDFGTITGMG